MPYTCLRNHRESSPESAALFTFIEQNEMKISLCCSTKKTKRMRIPGSQANAMTVFPLAGIYRTLSRRLLLAL